ncbi:hypothetical protein KAJ61_01655 [Candidatus Parcubacteria bacterium]|nr:hypothetical protein [Candidatus Parcubacteria bacterium]
MGNLLKLSFWFNMTPGNLTEGALRLIVIFLISLLIGAVFFKILKNRKRNLYNKIWSKLHLFSLSNLIIGLFLLFFSYELLPFLSMRLWLLLWGLGMIVWLALIFKVFNEIPKIKEKMAKEDEYKKYLP